MKTLHINKKAFIDWYFDKEIKESFFDENDVLKKLDEQGVFTIKLDDILKNAGYLPEELAEAGQDLVLNEDGEIDKYAYEKIVFSNKKRFSLEKVTDYMVGKMEVKYFIRVDESCIDVAYDEQEAMEKYESAKNNYCTPTKEIVKVEYL